MPAYDFKCSGCGQVLTLKRRFSECSAPGVCPACAGVMTRRFSAQFQICANRAVDDPGNKYAFGFDETTRKETMKAADKEYEANWANTPPPAKRIDVKEAFRRQPLAELFHQMPNHPVSPVP